MLYLIVILSASAIIICANTLPSPSVDVLIKNSIAVAIGVVAIIAIDALSALIIRRLFPKRLFSPQVKLFSVTKKEHLFYNKFAIKHWKDRVPQLGIFTGFDKGKIKSISETQYLERFLLEANYGVAIHLANGILGFFIAFIPACSAPFVWIPIFAVNLILSLMPFAILRYNSYTLLRLYKRSQASHSKSIEKVKDN
ncbi:MAG: hypothetical protein E7649_02440 [Ruminococcaceae bacterium]|nr:hypothetical protein [Oscillospiraceae bacterium]